MISQNPGGFLSDSGRIPDENPGRQAGFRVDSEMIPARIRPESGYLTRGSNKTLGYFWCDGPTATLPR